MRRLSLLAIGMLLTINPVVAILVNETCLNDTHLMTHYSFNTTMDGTVTTNEYLQVEQCTHNCTNDKCRSTSYSTDLSAMYVSFLVGAVFMIYGLYENSLGDDPIEDGFNVQNIMKHLGFFVGLYVVYMSLSMGRGITYDYGGSSRVTGALDRNLMIMTWTMMILIFVYVLQYFASLIRHMDMTKERKKWSNDD